MAAEYSIPGAGDNQLARAEHFGYAPHSMGEVITHRDDPQGAVTDWIDSVYHRLPLMRADLVELGYGDAYLDAQRIQVMDVSFRERSTGRIVVYPAADQSGVPVAFNGNEIPDPAPNATYPIGYPVTATFDRLRQDKAVRKIGRNDLLIACISLAQDATLVTRNTKDFSLVPGLKLANWAD